MKLGVSKKYLAQIELLGFNLWENIDNAQPSIVSKSSIFT